MRKIVLTYGIISGVILGTLLGFTTRFHDQIGFGWQGMALGYTIMVLAMLLIYYGIRSYRDTVGGGTVSFGKACSVGGLIFLLSTSGYIASWMIISARSGEDYMQKYSAHVVAEERAKGTPPAEIAAKEQEMAEFAEMYKNPLIKIAFTFLEPLPVGLIMTLGSAWYLSRRRSAA